MKKLLLPILVIALTLVAILAFLFIAKRQAPLSQKGTPVSSSHDMKSRPSSSVASVKKEFVVPPPPQAIEQQKMVQDIRKDLQTIMDLNRQINAVHQTKAEQLVRVTEQAQIHQKILADIQAATSQTKARAPKRETLLAQEKLRIIREETLRNKKLVEDVAQKTKT